MRNPFKFFTELLHQQFWIVLWAYYLIILNLSSAVFWNEPFAKLTFLTFIISYSSIIWLYAHFGFEKIIGLGHIFWFPLLYYLLPQIAESSGSYQIYLVVLSVSLIVSLAFDTVDVWNYFTREKSPESQPRPVGKRF